MFMYYTYMYTVYMTFFYIYIHKYIIYEQSFKFNQIIQCNVQYSLFSSFSLSLTLYTHTHTSFFMEFYSNIEAYLIL